jgi:UDP-hydrolysing UDP-N-acetyl-D-glucosamine 2-epimerase
MSSSSSTKRKICVVTGSRADYGLLKPLIGLIRQNHLCELQIVVTGMHLAPEFGRTLQHILEDGFAIDAEVDSLLSSDSRVAVAKSVGIGTQGFADAFHRLSPDLIVILGDRYEIFAAATAAMMLQIPLAHIHGGEVTEGAIDESIRHAITKMSHLHFTAAEAYRLRVVQMGENPDLVFNVGAPGLDLAAGSVLKCRRELESALQFSFFDCNFLLTFHPETLSERAAEDDARQILAALDQFPEAAVIVTLPNADPTGRALGRKFQQYASKNENRVLLVPNLGPLYFDVIHAVDVVVGNSSSGLIEVPFFKKPTVNIGDRQKGRLRADSIIDCCCRAEKIVEAIRKALQVTKSNAEHLFESPYGLPGASQKIMKHLVSADLSLLKRKPFFTM